MQPLGRKPTRFPSKKDHRFVRLRNWWEDIKTESKKSHRQHEKEAIRKELEE